MAESQTIRNIGEAVDRLITVDLPSRGLITTLYEAARKSIDGQPLALTAAQRMLAAAAVGKPVIIATGLPIRGWFSQAIAENDGPVGAATLARAVFLASGSLPILICEEEQVSVLKACVRAAGLTPTTLEAVNAAAKSPHAVPGRKVPVAVVQGFPADRAKAERESEGLLALSPSSIVSIERQGANDKGVYHYGRGEANYDAVMAKIDLLFEAARKRGVLTIGIGDGGNELGMGRIKDVIRKHVPFGAKCACPCGSGMAPEVNCDILLTATVSNFGCWGISACLAALTGNLNVLHGPEVELAVIQAGADAGAVDGVTGFIEPLVDALPAETCASLVALLQTIVRNGLNPPALFRMDKPR